MDDYKRKKHIEFLKDRASHFKDILQLNKRNVEDLLSGLCELHEIPFPPSELRKHFLHPNIIDNLLIQVVNSKNLSRDDRISLHEPLREIQKKIKRVKSNYSIDYRILEPSGRYPNIELSRGGNKYTINNQYPILITKSRNKKDISADSSIINWLTRTELKFATSIMCAPQYGMLHLYFNSQNSLKIDSDCLENVNKELQPYFLKEIFDIERRFKPVGSRYWSRQPLADVNEYEFEDFRDNIQFFEQLFDNFTIQDDLLLRTCNYFVKSIMHWDNFVYAEDAIINNFMCLEGCLHLIQKKYGDYKPQLNRPLLATVFKNDIPDGENLYDFISQGYELRISLIHAEPKWGAEWGPFVEMADFYDYYKINRLLLNFILINRTFDMY